MKKFTKMNIYISIFMVTALFFPILTKAETITVCADHYPPQVIIENNMVKKGISIEIVKEVCKQIGVSLKFKKMPLKRILRELKNGTITATTPLFYTKERSKYLYYPKPQITAKKVIAALKESNLKVKNLDDLKGKTVGVQANASLGDKFDKWPGIIKKPTYAIEQIIQMLDKGRFDAAGFQDELMFRFISRKLGIRHRFKIIYVISEAPVYTVFSKKALGAKGPDFVEKFSNSLEQLKKEGVIQKILNKY